MAVPRGKARHRAQPKRLAWPDAAKGVSIVGVVLLHISLVVPDADLQQWLVTTNKVLSPLRMPLFFLVSGYFSTKVLRQSFGQLMLKRVWFFLVPYFIWIPIQHYASSWHYHLSGAGPLITLPAVMDSMFRGHNMGWFLYALALFNIALWLLKFLPRWLAMVLSVVIPLVCLPYYEHFHMVSKALMYLPLFLVGALFKDSVTQFVYEVRRAYRSPRGAIYVAISVALYVGGLRLRAWWDSLEGLQTADWPLWNAETLVDVELLVLVKSLQQYITMPFAIMCVLVLAATGPLSWVFQVIGRNTLPIYLSHPVALSLAYGLVRLRMGVDIVDGGAWPWENPNFWIIYCVVMCGLVGFLVWGLNKIPVLGWLVQPPHLWILEDHVDGVAERRAERRHARQKARQAAKTAETLAARRQG